MPFNCENVDICAAVTHLSVFIFSFLLLHTTNNAINSLLFNIRPAARSTSHFALKPIISHMGAKQIPGKLPEPYYWQQSKFTWLDKHKRKCMSGIGFFGVTSAESGIRSKEARMQLSNTPLNCMVTAPLAASTRHHLVIQSSLKIPCNICVSLLVQIFYREELVFILNHSTQNCKIIKISYSYKILLILN